MTFKHYSTKTPFNFDSSYFMVDFESHALRPELVSLRMHPESDQICFETHRELTTQEKLDLDQLVAAHDPMPIERYRSIKNAEIDLKTRELIGQGFVWNTILFSASETAQRNWMGIDQFRDDLTYPFGISTKDDGEYFLADAIEVHTFVLYGLGVLETHYSSGRALKQQVNAAVDQAAVDAVIDGR